MYRLAVAALLGALVGAIVAAGVSLLAFTYPVQTEITNLPLDDGGNLRATVAIQTTIGGQTGGLPQAGIGELLEWRDGQALQCVCSDTR